MKTFNPYIILTILCCSSIGSFSQQGGNNRGSAPSDSLVMGIHGQKAENWRNRVGSDKENHFKKSASFIKMNGFLRYDFLYRSFTDTPFAQRDFRQHTVQANLELTINNRYPLRLAVATRVSNSPFYRNFLDFNLAWDKQRMLRMAKERLVKKLESVEYPELDLLLQAIESEKDKLGLLRYQLQLPDVQQRLIEERERNLEAWKARRNDTTALSISKSDSVVTAFSDLWQTKLQEADSLQKRLKSLQQKADSLARCMRKKLATTRTQISRATSLNEINKMAVANGVSLDAAQKGFAKFLSGVSNVGIGRSVLQYSDLTVMNVSLTGFHLEYNQGVYAALALGKVDYGFRDFLGRHQLPKSQDLMLGRLGWGDKDRLAFIVTAYTGTKIPYSATLPDSASRKMQIAGFSLEAIYKYDDNTSIVAEVAKSTRPISGRLKDNEGLNALFRFRETSNVAANLKAATLLRSSSTRVEGFVRFTGQHFQSFSLFQQNTRQIAWSVRVDQPFWKNRLRIMTQLRRNDFVNPFTEKSFKTSTLFASVQASLQIPKWPSLSVGYFPGTQIYLIDNERMRENAYYMLQAIMSYSVKLNTGYLMLTGMYNSYTTKATDSGFIQYSGNTYLLSANCVRSKWQFGGTWSIIDQPELRYANVEGTTSLAIVKWLRITGGVRLSQVCHGNSFWGGQAGMEWTIWKLGQIRLQYDKSFLPTIRRDLFPVETGRVGWVKTF